MLPPAHLVRQTLQSDQQGGRQQTCPTKRLIGLFPGLLNPVGSVLPDNDDDTI